MKNRTVILAHWYNRTYILLACDVPSFLADFELWHRNEVQTIAECHNTKNFMLVKKLGELEHNYIADFADTDLDLRDKYLF